MFADSFCDCQRGKDIHSQKRYTNKAMLSMYTGRNDDMELFERKKDKNITAAGVQKLKKIKEESPKHDKG